MVWGMVSKMCNIILLKHKDCIYEENYSDLKLNDYSVAQPRKI